MGEVTLLERMKDAGKTIGLKEVEYQEIVAALEAVRNLKLLCDEGRCPEFYRKHDDNLATMGISCVQLMVMDGGERTHFYGDDALAALRQCVSRLYPEVGR